MDAGRSAARPGVTPRGAKPRTSPSRPHHTRARRCRPEAPGQSSGLSAEIPAVERARESRGKQQSCTYFGSLDALCCILMRPARTLEVRSPHLHGRRTSATWRGPWFVASSAASPCSSRARGTVPWYDPAPGRQNLERALAWGSSLDALARALEALAKDRGLLVGRPAEGSPEPMRGDRPRGKGARKGSPNVPCA